MVEKLVKRKERQKIGEESSSHDRLVLPPITLLPEVLDEVDNDPNDPIDVVRASNDQSDEGTAGVDNDGQTGSEQKTDHVTSAPFITSMHREATQNQESLEHLPEVSDRLPEISGNVYPLPVMAEMELPVQRLSVPTVHTATASDFRRQLSHPPDLHDTSAAPPDVTTDAEQTGSTHRRQRRRSRIALDMSMIDYKKNPTFSEKLTALRRRVSQIETDDMTSRVRDFVENQTAYERRRRRQGLGRYSLDIAASL